MNIEEFFGQLDEYFQKNELEQVEPYLVRSLEEAKEAELLLHVLDYSDESYRKQKEVTEETLRDLGAGDIPMIHVYNKADRCMEAGQIPAVREDRIYMSAKTGAGILELVEMIRQKTAGYGN